MLSSLDSMHVVALAPNFVCVRALFVCPILSVCLFTYLFTCLLVCLFVCLFVLFCFVSKVHAVMLEARELEVVTSTLRATIARMHDRNRVMERTENGLSPLALAWLAEPLLHPANASQVRR